MRVSEKKTEIGVSIFPDHANVWQFCDLLVRQTSYGFMARRSVSARRPKIALMPSPPAGDVGQLGATASSVLGAARRTQEVAIR